VVGDGNLLQSGVLLMGVLVDVGILLMPMRLLKELLATKAFIIDDVGVEHFPEEETRKSGKSDHPRTATCTRHRPCVCEGQRVGGQMTDQEKIEVLATKLMGWTRMTYGQSFALLYPSRHDEAWAKDNRQTLYWHTADGKEVANAEDTDDYYVPEESWNPLTNAEHSKQVRDRLASLGFHRTELMCFGSKIYFYVYYNEGDSPAYFSLNENNEFRAVVECALKVVQGE